MLIYYTICINRILLSKATQIPFVKHIGITEENNQLTLDFKDDVSNHIETIHASAQFTLAETQSGIYLQSLFSEYEGKVIPVLRDAQIKYKKPAVEKISAIAFVDEELLEKFKIQFEKKGRGLIHVDVEVKDINDVLTSQGTFTWFIQTL